MKNTFPAMNEWSSSLIGNRSSRSSSANFNTYLSFSNIQGSLWMVNAEVRIFISFDKNLRRGQRQACPFFWLFELDRVRTIGIDLHMKKAPVKKIPGSESLPMDSRRSQRASGTYLHIIFKGKCSYNRWKHSLL